MTNHQPLTTNHDLRQTFWRADIYRLLALAFERPTSDTMEVINTITSELGKSSFGNDVLRKLLDELKIETCKNSPLMEASYHHLFTTDVACSPCEGNYHLTERGPIIGDVMAFYRAFQMRPIACEGPPDSIKMELGFMSFLCLKQADALEKNALDSFEITFNAQKKFLCDHLGRWAFQFADQLMEESDQPFYQTISLLLKDFLQKECQLFEIAPHPCPIKLPAAPSQEFCCE